VSILHELLASVLADGEIDDSEVASIREYLYRDAKLDLDDVKVLVELYCEARRRSAAFDDLFFDVLEQVILADGEIRPSEQFYLLKMLYSDREVRPREKEFLLKLRRTARHTTPQFDALCDVALQAHPTAWDVGGR